MKYFCFFNSVLDRQTWRMTSWFVLAVVCVSRSTVKATTIVPARMFAPVIVVVGT
jgi:hypothetical protein